MILLLHQTQNIVLNTDRLHIINEHVLLYLLVLSIGLLALENSARLSALTVYWSEGILTKALYYNKSVTPKNSIVKYRCGL